MNELRAVDFEIEEIAGSGFGSLGLMNDTAKSSGVELKNDERDKAMTGMALQS